MNEIMQIELIENKGPNNMRDELRQCLNSSTNTDIACAFINLSGLNLVLNDIRRNLDKANSHVRFLTRISKDAFNEPSALRTLLDLCKDYEGSLEVRTSRLFDGFHQKMYIFSGNESSIILVGSSNLTEKALIGEGEMNIKIIVSETSDLVRQFRDNFTGYWDEADDLTDEMIDAYAYFCRQVHSKMPDESDKCLWRRVLQLARKQRRKKIEKPEEEHEESRVWLDFINGFLSDETEKMIREYTNWDRFQYYSCGRKTYKKCKRNDILIIADYTSKRLLSANRIKSKTRISNTPDGRYFIAYQQIRKSRRKRLTKKLTSYMKYAGVIHKTVDLKPSSARMLSGERIKLLAKMLNFRMD